MMISGMGIVSCLLLGVNPADAKADPSGALTKLLDDAAQRLQIADPVAASKYVTGGAVEDLAREQQVLDSVSGLAKDVFRDQIDATESVEHSRIAAWKINPGSAPRAAPDLAASRDAIDELNKAMVDDIADDWNTLQGSTCRADLDHAKAAVTTMRHLDASYRQALDYAVHRYCR
jgi:chorismate mutase